MILDSLDLEYTLHVITDNHTIWIFMRSSEQRGYSPSEKRQTLEFNLEAALM